MDISPRIDLSKITDKENHLRFSFLIWLFFSSILIVGVYLKIRFLFNMDIPAHICFGLITAVILFTTVKIKRGKKAILLAFIPFIAWEIFEFIISNSVLERSLHGLFCETFANKIQDVTMDTFGFVVYMIFTRKKF